MTDHHTHPVTHEDPDAESLEWFVRYSQAADAGQADAALQTWLAGHPDRAAAFARWQADWRRLDALPAAGVARLRSQLAEDLAAANAPARSGWLERLAAPFGRAALAAVVLSVTGGGAYLAWDQWQQQPVFSQQFATPRGQQLDVQLPDGSRLRLDTATQVQVTLYRQRREVRLPEGQVEFHVQGDSGRPFDVMAGGIRVTVVGTRFAVRHTASQPVQVAVQEGQVRVAADGNAAHRATAVQLTAGQRVSADGDGRFSPIERVPASGIAPWRDGRIAFDNVPLAQVLQELERYGPTQLVVRDPAVAALRLTGTFDPRRLDSFRQSLPKVLPVRLQPSDSAPTEIAALH